MPTSVAALAAYSVEKKTSEKESVAALAAYPVEKQTSDKEKKTPTKTT